jgi:predicted ribosome quality control (RQC) complex YloA/Tae2 family protein
MSLTVQEIAAIIAELAPALSAGWIQKIYQPTPHAITLEVRTRSATMDASGRTLSLLISVAPEVARLHLITRRPSNPAAPPPFCQYLRAHIEGARIEQIEQVEADRIVRIRLMTREGTRSLVAELVGRKADILLLDSNDHVQATLHGARGRIGQGYELPRRPESFSKLPDAGKLGDIVTEGAFPVSGALEQHYDAQEQTTALDRQRTARQTHLRKQIKKTRRQIEALTSDVEKADRYKEYARYGELLKANLRAIEKGQSQVTVVDYFDPAMPELLIPLDPAKSARSNAEDYFKKHRKYLTAEREVRPRIQGFERELHALQTELAAIQTGTWQPFPTAAPSGHDPAQRSLHKRPGTPAPTAAHTPRSTRSGPFRRFTSADGLPIYVGRNARENEELTFGLARSDDLWLHARGTPGSHVVVRLERGVDPPVETLRDAATLALLYSDLKKSGKGEVIYTRRKYVRKMKGQGPGTVSVTQDKAIYLQLDRTRLQRLKNSHA